MQSADQRRDPSLPPRLLELVDAASTLIWDFDGVVADTEPVQAEAFALLLRRRGVVVPHDFFDELVGHQERDVWQVLLSRYSLSDDIDDLVAERSAAYLEEAHTLRVAPYVSPLLDKAAKRGKDSVIVSSGNYRHVGALLTIWDIAARFAAVYCVGAPGAPDVATKRERLEHVLSHWPAPFLLLEDNPEYLRIAEDRGVFTVAVQHSLNNVADGPWDVVLDFHELSGRKKGEGCLPPLE